MTLDEITRTAIDPALVWLPPKMNTVEARVQLLTTGLQESKFEHRFQVLNTPGVKGPARSFWQMEEGGGIKGVMNHPASAVLARAACGFRGVPFDRRAIWLAIEVDDLLAAIFARLLYFTDPGRLPPVTQPAEAWALYLRTWRPGKPKPDTWPTYHRQARAFMGLP